MCNVAIFTFNPFQENTYVLFDETNECVIIDPGCLVEAEEKTLSNFIESKNLIPVKLLNTHAHLDHIFGNAFVAKKYNLGLELHRGELSVLHSGPTSAKMFGIDMKISPEPSHFIEEGDIIKFGNTTLKTLFTPGHSPASISFYCETGNFVIGGDVLFRESIGRTDLPGGNFDTLINSIRTQLFTLNDDVKVFSGHGTETTIGHERKYNPFLQ